MPPSSTDASKAYAGTHRGGLSGAALEREALLKAAQMLDFARTHPGDAEALLKALNYNMELWTIFQADLLDEKGTMSQELRQNLVDLSLFMDSATVKNLAGFDAGTLMAMIEINRNLADR